MRDDRRERYLCVLERCEHNQKVCGHGRASPLSYAEKSSEKEKRRRFPTTTIESPLHIRRGLESICQGTSGTRAPLGRKRKRAKDYPLSSQKELPGSIYQRNNVEHSVYPRSPYREYLNLRYPFRGIQR